MPSQTSSQIFLIVVFSIQKHSLFTFHLWLHHTPTGGYLENKNSGNKLFILKNPMGWGIWVWVISLLTSYTVCQISFNFTTNVQRKCRSTVILRLYCTCRSHKSSNQIKIFPKALTEEFNMGQHFVVSALYCLHLNLKCITLDLAVRDSRNPSFVANLRSWYVAAACYRDSVTADRPTVKPVPYPCSI